MREALAQIAEEGLYNVERRHKQCAERLYTGLKALGLELFVEDPSKRLPTVTTVKVSDKWCWRGVISFAMKK